MRPRCFSRRSTPNKRRPPRRSLRLPPFPLQRRRRRPPRRPRPRRWRRRRRARRPPIPQARAAPWGRRSSFVAHPAATVDGKADRDEVFGAITGSIDQIHKEIAKAGLKAAGRPIAIFLEADDVGFKYRAAIPLESAPEGKTELSDTVKLGRTPVGKAMRFEHRGAYDDIDATYEAITAYLDEKGIDAQDMFIEEYLNDVKTTDDPNLQVDIFVLLK